MSLQSNTGNVKPTRLLKTFPMQLNTPFFLVCPISPKDVFRNKGAFIPGIKYLQKILPRLYTECEIYCKTHY